MPPLKRRDRLSVEGVDDAHSIRNLVKAHQFNFDTDERLPEIRSVNGDEEQGGGVDRLLSVIEEEVRAATGRTVGYVLDADAPILDRWRAVRDRLRKAGVDPIPETPPADGFIGTSLFRSRVGVWLMPDNRADGDLESFLRLLISPADPLIVHAEDATSTARGLGATFGDPDRRKAVLHAWLAWQLEPGRPYGTAITAQYFAHEAEVARRFVGWYARLFQLQT